jgi:hypothetical protein
MELYPRVLQERCNTCSFDSPQKHRIFTQGIIRTNAIFNLFTYDFH